MAASGPLPTVLGLVLVASGAGLLFFALHTHAERADEAVAQAAASASAAVEAAKAASRRAPPPPSVPTASTAAALPTAPTASAPPAASASAAPSASVSAAADAGAPPDGGTADGGEGAKGPAQADVFHFGKGGIVLPKEEITRLVSLAKELRQKGGGAITIEGYGDEAGTAEPNVTLGRRRATVVRQLFGDIGFDSDRLMIATPDAGNDASLLGSVRVRPGVPGAEGKSP